jgi:UDP-N-acetylglucosamine 2-epimerase (non-hydrolysing)
MHVVGARPNFMKAAPLISEMAKFPNEFTQLLVHTGQHYDTTMSEIFFEELELPKPDVNLEVGSGSHDVNSTMACTLVASKLGFKVAHVEAGLRSFDRTMPEELNRLITDQLADLLFTPSYDANENLLREGIQAEKIHFVGNVMIDTLIRLLPKAEERWPELQKRFELSDPYMLVTLHRPVNVDDPAMLAQFVAALNEINSQIRIVFPVHPRTRNRITGLGLTLPSDNLLFIEPLGYLDFLALQSHSSVVLTDSGGVQEETTYLGVPCLTARPNTERPVTITDGTNRLVKSNRLDLINAIEMTLNNEDHSHTFNRQHPKLWDGRAAERIVRTMSIEI